MEPEPELQLEPKPALETELEPKPEPVAVLEIEIDPGLNWEEVGRSWVVAALAVVVAGGPEDVIEVEVLSGEFV